MKTAMKFVTTSVAVTLVLAMLSGCGAPKETNIDGTKTVATVNGESIPLGVLSLYTRRSQAQTEYIYRSYFGMTNIWDAVHDEASGITEGDEAVEENLGNVESLYILRQKAADYGVEISEESKAAISAAADAFLAANSEETIAVLGVTKEQVEEFLSLLTIQSLIYDPIVADADTTVDEAEAQQASFSYLSFSFSSSTEEEKAAMQENAQAILDAILAAPDADMAETAKSVDETASVLNGTFTFKETDNEYLTVSYADELVEVLRTLSDGEIYPELIETDTNYYIVRMKSVNDADATASKIESVKSSMQSDFYTETLDGWTEAAEINVNADVLKTLKMTDSHTFTIVYSEEETEEETAEIETEEAVEASTEEAISATTEAVVEATTEATTEAAVTEVTTVAE